MTYVSKKRVRNPYDQRWMIHTAWLVEDEPVLASELHALAMHSSLNDDGDLMYSSKHRKEWDHVLHSDTYYGVGDVEPLWERDEGEFCVGGK